MALRTSATDENLLIEEGLDVKYSHTTIQGTWTYVAGVSTVTLYTMQECHRYARKNYRYVGMTYEAALVAKESIKQALERDVYASFYNNGTWTRELSGSAILADVSMQPAGGDAWDVVVSINEDDVAFLRANESFRPQYLFSHERQRTYGSDGHGTEDETEGDGNATEDETEGDGNATEDET